MGNTLKSQLAELAPFYHVLRSNNAKIRVSLQRDFPSHQKLHHSTCILFQIHRTNPHINLTSTPPPNSTSPEQKMAEPLSTPRITSQYLDNFNGKTIRMIGKVTQLRGTSASIDAEGPVTVILNQVCFPLFFPFFFS